MVPVIPLYIFEYVLHMYIYIGVRLVSVGIPVIPWYPLRPPDGPRVAVNVRSVRSMIFGLSQGSLQHYLEQLDKAL